MPLHRPVTDEEVAEGVVADVALVRRPARVGVHAEHVIRRARIVRVDLVGAVVRPAPLPALFDLGEVVDLCHPPRIAAGRRRPDQVLVRPQASCWYLFAAALAADAQPGGSTSSVTVPALV